MDEHTVNWCVRSQVESADFVMQRVDGSTNP